MEQRLACTDAHSNDLRDLYKLLEVPSVSEDYKVRLVMLYALRYEKMTGHQLPALMDLLKRQAVPEEKLKWIPAVLKFSSSDVRQVDSFSLESILSKGKNAFKGLKGVENIYTQHNPHLAQTIENVVKNKLKENLYPFVEGSPVSRDK